MEQEKFIVSAELVDGQQKAISIVDESDIVGGEAVALKEALLPYFVQAQEWLEIAKTLQVTDVSQVDIMKKAKDTRKALRDIRIALEARRKELKEESLRKGKAIDGVANVLKGLISPIEEYLEEQENFVKIQQEKEKARIISERTEILVAIGVNVSLYKVYEMTQEDFDELVSKEKTAKELREKAEAEAIAQQEEQKRKDNEEREAQKAKIAELEMAISEQKMKDREKEEELEKAVMRVEEEQKEQNRTIAEVVKYLSSAEQISEDGSFFLLKLVEHAGYDRCIEIIRYVSINFGKFPKKHADMWANFISE